MKTMRSVRFLLAAVLLALSGCGFLDLPLRKVPAAEVSLAEPAAGRPSPPPKSASLRAEIRRQLAARNYRAALRLARREVEKGAPEAHMEEEYGLALNGLVEQAAGYWKEGRPGKAGELYRVASDFFPQTEAGALRVGPTLPEIRARLEECAGELMERGLVDYRAGDLDGAIRTWKRIQSFHPDHRASRKALETAEVQRANLERVDSGE